MTATSGTRTSPRAQVVGLPRRDTPTLLAGRYRLVEAVPTTGPSALWHAEDEVLARHVAVRILGDDRLREPFLRAAVTAGRVVHPDVAGTYDAVGGSGADGDGDDPDGQLTYVVSSWANGVTLRDLLLGGGPLEPAEAVHVARHVASGLVAAHARSVAHGRLHPGNVLIGPGGAVVVTDLATAAALEGPLADDVPLLTDAGVRSGAGTRTGLVDGRPADDDLSRAMAADVVGLGRLTYAALTGRWPGRDDVGLPAAPLADGDPAPRRVRAGVPRELDALVARTVAGGAHAPRTAEAFLGELAAFGATPPSVVPTAGPEPFGDILPFSDQPAGGGGPDGHAAWDIADEESGLDLFEPAAGGVPPGGTTAPGAVPPARRRRRRGALPLALVLVVALLAAAGAVVLVRGFGGDGPPDAAGTPSPAVTPDATQPPSPLSENPTPVAVTATSSFDPQGDGSENNDRVKFATDGDPATVWQTDTYRCTGSCTGRSGFGNLKDGVGLLLDLGSDVPVRQVAVTSPYTGMTVQLRTGTQRADDADGYRTVASAEKTAGQFTLVPQSPVTARYLVLWITQLSPTQGGAIGGFAEVTVSR